RTQKTEVMNRLHNWHAAVVERSVDRGRDQRKYVVDVCDVGALALYEVANLVICFARIHCTRKKQRALIQAKVLDSGIIPGIHYNLMPMLAQQGELRLDGRMFTARLLVVIMYKQ